MSTETSSSLFSTTSYVEAPFIWVTIGGVTLGKYTKTSTNNTKFVNYPNFVQSLTVVKYANAMANVYTLQLVYAITQNSDPNLLEKIFSKAKSEGRKIKFSYGDSNTQQFMYKEEEAIISKIVPSFDITSSQISYTITAVSASYSQSQTSYTFTAFKDKPSNKIKQLFSSDKYGLLTLFPGMDSKTALNKFIDSDDAVVSVPARNETVLSYINTLVSYMRYNQESSTSKKSIYKFAVFDNVDSNIGGAYIKVSRITKNSPLNTNANLYPTVDIGYPTQGNVIRFTPNLDESYSILYDYNSDIKINNNVYTIDNTGKVVSQEMEITRASNLPTTEATKTWWTQMTSYPYTATLELRGLLKNVYLIDKLNVNVYFYGQKSFYSGLFVITGQTDSISSSGYKTTLTLMRVSGEEL
jgi:hypothetical protein